MACKLCQQGVRLIDGDHWIVKSIIPSRITIKRCPDAPKPPSPPLEAAGSDQARVAA